MLIKLLRLLSNQELTLSELNTLLDQTSLNTLEQINKINYLNSSSNDNLSSNLNNWLDYNQASNMNQNLIINEADKYKLTKSINWLNHIEITNSLKKNQLAYNLIILDEVDSTNNYAIGHIHEFKHNTIITCEWQNNGRGRFGRTWLSKIAFDITVSIVYFLPKDFNTALLPMICAVAINRLLKNYSIKNAIKWPNDIYVDINKVCGILIENIVRNNDIKTVIGIGLNNLNNWDRNRLLVDLIVCLENIINEFKLFGFALLRREWLDNCCHLHKKIALIQQNVEIDRGIHEDLSESGELIVSTKNNLKKYSSSAISLIIL